jgi:hypothetical protein
MRDCRRCDNAESRNPRFYFREAASLSGVRCRTFPSGQAPGTDVFVSKDSKFPDGARRIVSHGGRIEGRGRRPKW